LTRPAFAEVPSDKFGFFSDFGIDKITKMWEIFHIWHSSEWDNI
jgi:hypothetical protein